MKIGKNTLFYILVAVLFFALKLISAEADSGFFYFLLQPIASLLHLFSGFSGTLTQEGAFLFSEFNILIDRSCSGFNFMLLCFFMVCFMLIGHLGSTTRKIMAIPFSMLVAYLLTILVNTSRVLVAITVQHTLAFDHPAIHQAIGIFIYLSSLILCYQVLHIFLNRQNCPNAKLI